MSEPITLPAWIRDPLRKPLKPLVRKSYAYALPYVSNRCEIPHILNERGLTGTGVEIGVKEGEYSEILLDAWEGETLYLVDPWSTFDETYVDIANTDQETHNVFLERARARVARFGDRTQIVRKTSEEAAPTFADGSLDFAYIDAQHHYEAVKQDIELWYPKVKSGGMLAGHDYLDGMWGQTLFGVKQAVDEFARQEGLSLHVTRETSFRSWFLFKP